MNLSKVSLILIKEYMKSKVTKEIFYKIKEELKLYSPHILYEINDFGLSLTTIKNIKLSKNYSEYPVVYSRFNRKCNCKFQLLKRLGYNPMNHAFNCPIREGKTNHKVWKKLLILPEGNNPYKEVNRFKEEYIKINRINEKKSKSK